MKAEPRPDPSLEEIREIREKIGAEFGHDPDRLVAYYMEYQKKFGDRLLSDPPRTNPPALKPAA